MIVPPEISDRLFAECFGRLQAYEELGRLCDTIGGRTSGTQSGARGEDWAFDLMTRWGLEKVHFEEFPLSVWTRGPLLVEALSPAAWILTALSHGNAPTFAEVTAPVINVGHGEREDYELLKGGAAGKLALCDEGVAEGHRGLHRSEKMRLAAQFGAAALMIYSSAPGGLPRTGNCCKHEAPIPSLGISQEDGLRLLRLIHHNSKSPPVLRIRMSNTITSGVARNVVGDLMGCEFPDEVVLAGAHLDSWDVSQGATDNGLGTAIVLEIGRAMAALPRRPRRTVRLGVWAAEEVGLCGSRVHSILHAAELENYVAVMNYDMTADPFGFWAPKIASESDSPESPIGFEILRELCNQLRPIGMRSEFRHKAGLHSDHQPFMLEGVQAISLLAENQTKGAYFYHSVGDTFDKVSMPAMARAAAVGAHTLWALADSPQRPFPKLSVTQVRRLIDEADLYEALVAEGYDGPIMHEPLDQ